MLLNQEVVVVMCGDIEKDSQSGKWRPSDHDDHGILFGPQMIEAAALLWSRSENPITLVVTGGKTNVIDGLQDRPNIAKVNADALMELRIPGECIVLETKAENTLQQLQYVAHLIRKSGQDVKVSLLAMQWHVSRIEATRCNAKHPDNHHLVRVDPLDTCPIIPVEAVLVGHDAAKWGPFFQQAWKTEAMSQRFLGEWIGTSMAWGINREKGHYRWKPAVIVG